MTLWIPTSHTIGRNRLMSNHIYWIFKDTVRKATYYTDYYTEQGGYFEYYMDGESYTTLFNEVKYIMPYTEPGDPDTGEHSGFCNIMPLRELNLDILV